MAILEVFILRDLRAEFLQVFISGQLAADCARRSGRVERGSGSSGGADWRAASMANSNTKES
jgi:hypothetical protein